LLSSSLCWTRAFADPLSTRYSGSVCPRRTHLFIIAHELWQPAHIRLFSQLLSETPRLTKDRERVHEILLRVKAEGPDVRNNGLQAGLIRTTHGIAPLMATYQWTTTSRTWHKLRKFARRLRALPTRLSAAAFNKL
jgi:hypothetical protein